MARPSSMQDVIASDTVSPMWSGCGHTNAEKAVVASAKSNKPFALLFYSSWGQCRACKGIDFIMCFIAYMLII